MDRGGGDQVLVAGHDTVHAEEDQGGGCRHQEGPRPEDERLLEVGAHECS